MEDDLKNRKTENDKKFTGTLLEEKLRKIEKRACRNKVKWFTFVVLIFGAGAYFIVFGGQLGQLKYWLWALIPVSLLVAILRYDKFYHERKGVQKLIVAYLQREAGGDLGIQAEIWLNQFYGWNNDPPGEKSNMLERIIQIFLNRKES